MNVKLSNLERHARWMIRAMGDLGASRNYPVPLHQLARYMEISEAEAHKALLLLRKDRLAKKRSRRGEECWEPW